MEPIRHCRGDLLECDADFIAHQCNCVTTRGKELAAAVFKRFPESDIYTERTEPATPGWNVVRGRVVNMLAQYYPGRARFDKDSSEKRFRWFQECLEGLATALPLKTEKRPLRLAFPWRIGCGLAGGDWVRYLEALRAFARVHVDTIQVEIYQLLTDHESVPVLPETPTSKPKRQMQLTVDRTSKHIRLQ